MIETSKNEYTPSRVSPPGTTLADLLEERSLSQRELAKRMGRPVKTINEIIKGKTAITQDTALALELAVGVPASFWNAREARYREFLARTVQMEGMKEHGEWVRRFPYLEMSRLRWVTSATRVDERARELLGFFAVASPDQWAELYERPQVAFRRSPKVKGKAEAISAWLRRGELQAQAVAPTAYSADRLLAALETVRSLTRESDPTVLVPKLRSAFARAGVAVVFTQELKGCGVSGVTRWLASGQALIQLNLRYKRDDHLWFTLFHEAGHVILHPKKRTVFLDADGSDGSDEEAEANRFASDRLIPPSSFAAFSASGKFTPEAIAAFAREIGVSTGIVVGRLQYERLIPFGMHDGLKQRLTWSE